MYPKHPTYDKRTDSILATPDAVRANRCKTYSFCARHVAPVIKQHDNASRRSNAHVNEVFQIFNLHLEEFFEQFGNQSLVLDQNVKKI